MLDGLPSVNVGITAVTVAQNLREDGSLSPEYTHGLTLTERTTIRDNDQEYQMFAPPPR